MGANERETLLHLLGELALKVGDFVLTSGRRSDVLVDVKRAALHPTGTVLIGALGYAAITARWPQVRAVGGRTLGADPIAVAIARASADVDPLHAFIVRKEPKGHGSAALMECSGGMEPGWPVVILEDTSTTGGSALKGVEAVRAEGYEVLGVFTLVDREEGAAERFAEAGIPFERLFSMAEIRAAKVERG